MWSHFVSSSSVVSGTPLPAAIAAAIGSSSSWIG
jgi:hypothetical protein